MTCTQNDQAVIRIIWKIDENLFKSKEYYYNPVRISRDCREGVNMPKKVQVTFSNGQWKLIEKLKGTIGDTDSEVVRNIVIAYLSEKSYIKEEATKRE